MRENIRERISRNTIRMIGFSILWMGIICLVGCDKSVELQSDMQNVEQRDYATILLVSKGNEKKNYEFSVGIAEEKKVGEKGQNETLASFYANDFEELAKEYQSVKGKTLSLVHLKVILLEEDKNLIIEEQWDILNQLNENKEVAKTCPVLQITEKDEFMKYLEKAKEPVGSYITNLIRASENQGKNIPWLKDYVKVLREGTSLKVYFIEKQKEGWQLKCRAEVTFSIS